MTHQTIHWLGAGLSSGPGIVRLADSGRDLVLWNRTVRRAEDVFAAVDKPATTSVRRFGFAEFRDALRAGDIVVSMLPATMHLEIAAVCLEKNAHLVTTSYISEGMRQLDGQASAAGLCFVNECGLDPGIDHVFAHLLVKAWKESAAFDPRAALDFKSYCGGVPKQPGDFKYKFSWSPAGVLRALTNRARFIEQGRVAFADRAWEAVKNLAIRGEVFEVYPNRDSVPYVRDYGFEDSWDVQGFVRGTIRLGGWSQAWQSIFAEIPGASDQKIEAMGADLWRLHAYGQDEQDRVVLFVSLTAQCDGHTVFDQSYFIDEAGSGRATAMARLVSWPATYAVEAVAQGRVNPGVSGAPCQPAEMNLWLENLRAGGVGIRE
jgi:hypothetical protein